MRKTVYLLMSVSFILWVTVAHAAYLEVLRGGNQPLLAYPPDGRVSLSAEKSQHTASLPSGDAWKAAYDATAGTVSLTCIKGVLDLLVSCSVRISVPEGSTVVLKLNAAGYIESLEFPKPAPGSLIVSFAGAMSFGLEPGSKLVFTYLADGTMRIDVTAGGGKYTDPNGTPRSVTAGFFCFTGCDRPLPYWRIAAPADQRPASAGTP